MSLSSVLRACCWRGLGRRCRKPVRAKAVTAPLFAGFEGARLHWNGHDCLVQTNHIPGKGMARHYAAALAEGAQGFRDTLPERCDPLERWHCARAEAPEALIVWGAVHFDQPPDPIGHAQRLAAILGPHDKLLAVTEPAVGFDVSGYTCTEATALAAAIMGAALAVNPELRFWTCDPVHHCREELWVATDALMRLFGSAIEAVGVNYHGCHAGDPLRDVLRMAADRYPAHRIAITETSWHDGLPAAEARFPHIRSRSDWWQHVQAEIDASGVPIVCAVWEPWLDMSWDSGAPWPNGWPAHQMEVT